MSREEDRMVSILHKKALLEKYKPLLEQISKYDSPDAMIKKTLPMSVLGLIISQFSENETIAQKARIEIINRGMGKPVERTVNIYGDIAQLNEQDLDNQILRLFQKNISTPLLANPARPRKQGRKPRKSNPLVTTTIEARASAKAEGPDSPRETGSPASPENKGTS